MVLKTAVMTEEEKHRNLIARQKVLVTSSLGFLRRTNGIRAGELSVFIGKSGQGKSTISKTISIEAAINSVKTYCLLSEEPVSVYKQVHFDAITSGCPIKPERYLNNIYFESMLDWGKEKLSSEYLLERIEEIINDYKTDLVIMDNVSTSFMGDLTPKEQGELVASFRKLADTYEVAFACFVHTKKGTDIRKTLISGDDVRGSGSWSNGSSYVYMLSTYFEYNPPIALLHIDKARNHPKANKTYWHLKYDEEMKIYTHDRPISFSEAAKIQREASKGE